MTKLLTVVHDGFYWLVCDLDTGLRVWLHKQGKVGDLICPGQKMKED